MSDTRLIERWMPIAALGEESVRERRSLQALPPTYYLHVWWARRPLVASRAAILASLLPADADREKFMHVLGIHGDPVAVRRKIDAARRRGQRFEGQAYSYPRAFGYIPNLDDKNWLIDTLGRSLASLKILDPTAGGGSVPFEVVRLGTEAAANDLNPVSTLIMRATIEWPSRHGTALKSEFKHLSERFIRTREERLTPYFPPEENLDAISTNFIWARTIICPYCDGRVPLSPNWRLAPDGTGVRLKPELGSGPGSEGRICSFEIVQSAKEQSEGTVARGAGTCPYPDCSRVIDGDEIKRQAQAGQMGEQLFTVVYKKRVEKILKSGKRGKDKWVRGYRLLGPRTTIAPRFRRGWLRSCRSGRRWTWCPARNIPEVSNDDRPIQYGMPLWRDLFSPRQLLCHGTSVEVFREMLAADRTEGKLNEVRKAAYGYLALSIDKFINWNARLSSWNVNLEGMRSVFDRHDFAFKWSYAEMAPLIVGLGYDWVIGQTAKCIRELIALVRPDAENKSGTLFDDADAAEYTPPPVTITCKPGDSLDHIEDGSIDVVVMDPPYYANVMYAELSDFFYVWLKRTAGHVFPELFRRHLTDKDNEAVANPARFKGEKGAGVLAGRDYQERMASIFAECRRTLKPGGIMTLMFTHKKVEAWDALTKGLMEAGFAISASWPIHTEPEGSLHIRNKAAAKTTIFLVCRPRAEDMQTEENLYWEDVEPRIANAVRTRVREFQEAGIAGVDLYLASFGPALEEFSRHWPLKRGTPREMPEERRRRRQQVLFEEEWDPYAATPEDALDAARREVKRWRLEQLTHLKANADLDPATAFFVLAWDAFKAPMFSYDEANRLARAVGVDLDKDVIGRLAEKKGSDILLWDSAHRAAKGTLGPVDGARGMIDSIHHAAHTARGSSLAAAQEMLANTQVDQDRRFFTALEAILEVLPVSKAFTGIELEGNVAAAGSDFEDLYNLVRLAYGNEIDEPEQLKLWQDDGA